MKVLDDDAELRAVLACLAVLPLVQLEPAFDEYRPSLGQILVHHLGGSTPRLAVHERGFVAVLAFAGSISSVHREPNRGDGLIRRCELQLDIPREVSHQKDFVDASSHARSNPQMVSPHGIA